MGLGQKETKPFKAEAARSSIEDHAESADPRAKFFLRASESSSREDTSDHAQPSLVNTTSILEKEYSHNERRSSRVRQQEEEGLNELAAPAPIRGAGDILESPQSNRDDPEALISENLRPLELSETATLLYTVSYLIFFSIFGVLARLGVQWLTYYPGAPIVIDNLWANVGGTFIMGFLSEDRKLFQQEWGNCKEPSIEGCRSNYTDMSHDLVMAHKKVKKTIPLFIGLATGFCGSFTSFSSFMRDVFFALSNNLPTPLDHPLPTGILMPSTDSGIGRNGGYSFMAVLAVVFLTIIMSIGALIVGAQLAVAVYKFTPTLPFRFFRKVVDPIFVFVALGCWLGAIFLVIWPPDRPNGSLSRGTWSNEVWRGEVLFAIVFAPLGCLLRWYTSLKLNTISRAFPIGTFVVNMVGVCIEGMCYDLQHVSLGSAGVQVGGGIVSCQVLQGLMDGFCGALTTVSTWASELESLKRYEAYLYGTASVVIGMLLMILIMGSVVWTVGWQSPLCVV